MSQGYWPPQAGGAPAGTLSGNAITADIANGASSLAVSFPFAMPDIDYGLVCNIRNEVDASPIFLEIVQTVKTVNGFTVIFNAPADSANYKLEYVASRRN